MGVIVLALAGGAGVFLLAQRLLGGWFLNSGRGVVAVSVAYAIVGVLVGFVRRNSVREATMVAAGAVATMIAVLFSIGPGSIFPIVIVFGAAIVAGSTAAGTSLGTLVRRALRPTISRTP